MMYGVMIVDDEYLVRQKLINNIDWNALGFNIVASVGKPEDAIKMFKLQKPDIIFVDIYLPRINGISLIEQIKNISEDVSIIIITGYASIDIAKKAIKVGAFDFILKPIDLKEVKNVLSRFKEKKEALNTTRHGAASPDNDIRTIFPFDFPSEIWDAKIDHSWVLVVRTWIEEHLQDSGLTLEKAASQFNMHPSSFTRKLKKFTGIGFNDFLTRIRLEKIIRLLLESEDYFIYEIGEIVGIYDAHYLSILFKKHVGTTITSFKSFIEDNKDK